MTICFGITQKSNSIASNSWGGDLNSKEQLRDNMGTGLWAVWTHRSSGNNFLGQHSLLLAIGHRELRRCKHLLIRKQKLPVAGRTTKIDTSGRPSQGSWVEFSTPNVVASLAFGSSIGWTNRSPILQCWCIKEGIATVLWHEEGNGEEDAPDWIGNKEFTWCWAHNDCP